MVLINPTVIVGKWEKGYALDVHTISSKPAGHDAQGKPKFDTSRSPMGELVNRLKYRGDRSAAAEIIDAAVRFLSPRRANVDVIVPVPPSNERDFQPVYVVADGIGAAHSRGPLRLDDVFRSGTTMNAITSVLLDDAKVAKVFALTMTYTRSHR